MVAAGLPVTSGVVSAQSVDRPWKAAVVGLVVTAGAAAGEIDVVWDAHPEGPDEYRVAWAPVGERFRNSSDSDWNAYPTTNRVTLSGLEPGDTYKVKVRARLGDRRSDWSSVETAAAAIAVVGLVVTAGAAAGEIDVVWDAHPGGPDEYRVAWAPVGERFRNPSDSDWNAYPTTNRVTLSGLEPGGTYKVKVRARLGDRRSDWSSVETAAAAIAVVGLVVTAGAAAGEIDVVWDAHPGGPDEYRVAWAPVGERFRNPSDSDWNAYPTTNRVTLSGLEPGGTYKVKVRARLGDRRSDWSSVETAAAATGTQIQQRSLVGDELGGADVDTRDVGAAGTAVPVVTSPGVFVVSEGSRSVATLAASDADTDVGDLVWSKEGGADAAAFTLNGLGVLAFGAAKDYEEPDDADTDGIYELTVQVSDGVNDVTADLVVTLDNVIELEAIEGPETVSFAENSWSRVATFTASSLQDRDGISWTLGGDDAALFSVDSPSGALRFDLDAVSPVVFAKPPNFETPVDSGTNNAYAVTLLPSSGVAMADSALSVTVTVTDVDEDGTVSLSTKRPRKGVTVTATLADPDGVVDGSAVWVWERTAGYNEWVTISGADASSYTPVAADAGSFLRVSVTYSDRHGSGAQAQATAPEVAAAAQLSGLSISTNDSVASTDAWRLMRPAFDAGILHYSVGCDDSDTMTLTMRPADGSSRISVDGTQYANPGANIPVTVELAVAGSSVVRISLTDAEGAETQYVVHCLSDDFGEVTVTKPLGEAKVLDELILYFRDGRLVIMDSDGVPRWHTKPRNVPGSQFFRFYPDGGGEPRYSYRGPGGTYQILDATRQALSLVSAVAPLTRADGHDFRVLEDGNYMLMAYQDTERDLSHLTFDDRTGAPYGTDVYVEDSAIQIVTPGGQATFNWNSWDHMPLEDCTQHFFPPSDGDYAHLNSIQWVDGLIIASMRGCSRVLAIDAVTGDVVWRVGLSNLGDAEWAARGIGPPPLEIVGDEEGQFCGQHGSSLLPNGNLILYDNGVQCTIDPWTRQNLLRVNEVYSRALEYALDLENGEAVFVRDHSLHGTESEVGYRGGNVELLSNGHWLVSWGAARPRNSPTPPPTDVFTQVDPDTGDEWLSVDGLPSFTRGTVMRPEFLVEDPPALEARFPASGYTSGFHSGVGDAPTVVVVFSRPPADFGAATPSLSVVGASVTAVAPHLVAGEPAYAYLVTLAPDGAGVIRVSLVAGRGCDVGGICAADGATLATVPAALVVDPPIEVSFGAAAYSVGEGATRLVPVVLGAAHGRAENVEVPVVGSGVNASADDFSVAASVIFAAGETRKTVSLDAVDDDLVEGSETVELSFGALPSGLLAGSTAVTTVTIADADTAAFEFGVASSEVSEGGETELTFAITNGVTFVGDQTISMVVAGSATAGDDFVLVDSQNQPLSAPYLVTLLAGANSVTAVLRVVNDSDEELAETVSLSATLASTGTFIGSRTVTISASDLDVPEVTITPVGAVSEGADAVFTLGRTATLATPLAQVLTVRVRVTTTGGILSGTPPASTVTFAAGDGTAELLVATTNDTVVEDAATVTALVRADTASPARYEAGSPNRATVTVRDDDFASFTVSASADAVVEGTDIAVTVDPGGVTFAQAQTLSVNVAGSATVGDDFALTDSNGDELVAPYELTLAARAGSTSLRIAAAVDAVEDDGETVVLGVLHDGSSVGTVTVTLVDTNDPPAVSGGSRFLFAENTTTDVATFTATDAEGDPVTWSVDGSDAALFEMVGSTLRFRAPPDFEMPADVGTNNIYDVTVLASDSEGSTSHNVAVTVTDVDEAATITSVSGSFVYGYEENATTVVATFTANDPERATIRWTLGGADAAVFEISDRGVLTLLRPPDFEHPVDADGDNEYRLQVQARAGANDPVVGDVTVNVSDVDEPGVVVLSSPQPQIDTALTAEVADPDSVLVVQTWTWQRKLGSGPWENITTATARSYTPVAADVGYDLRVEATYLDGAGTGTDTAAVQAAYPARAAPSGTNSDPDFGGDPVGRSVAENSAPGAAVGSAVRAADTSGDAARLAYTLSGADADFYHIDGSTGQIRVGANTVLDYEAAVSSYSVTVTATDPSGASDDISVTIEVADVNEAPTAGHDTATAAEDGRVVIAVLANDSDPEGDTLTVALRDSPLHGRVAVQPDKTLAYTPTSDFNGKDIFTYTASDGRLTNEAIVTVTVSPVNDQPKFSTPTVQRNVPDDAQPGSPVGPPVTADDIDGDTLTYDLFELDAPLFTIDENTGQIRVAEGTVIDRSVQTRYRLRVEATDPHGARVRTLVNITVTTTSTTTGRGGGGSGGGGGVSGGGGGPAQDTGAPEFTEGSRATRSVGEHTMPGTNIGSPLTAVDPDGDPLTYTLGGTHADLFDLDESSGQLLTKAALDYETNNNYTVTIDVGDNKDPEGEPDRRRDDSIQVSILVTNQDDPGVLTPSAPTPRVDQPYSAAVTDPDGGVSGLAWQWDRSPDRNTWTPIDGATSGTYTPTADDQGHHLRVTATYTDPLGGNKTTTREVDAAVTTGIVTEFEDVAADGVHTPAIEALATEGVFADTECAESLFCPHEPIQRWVMAIWMIRLLTEEPPAVGDSRFDDIADGQWWIRYVEQLADRGITVGCTTNPPQYCPQRSVTRAQMATFLVRALQLQPAAPAGFTDTQDNTHTANIDALSAAGITVGCSTEPLRYCPNQPVTRAQIATLLHRALNP